MWTLSSQQDSGLETEEGDSELSDQEDRSRMKGEQIIGFSVAMVIFAIMLPTVLDLAKAITSNSTLAQDLNQSYGSLFTFLPVIIGAGVMFAIVRHFISAPEEVDIPALEEGEEVEDYDEARITREIELSHEPHEEEEEVPTPEAEVECSYCQTVYSRMLDRCPYCSAPRRRPIQ